MNLRLLLEDYLGLMREEGELDAFLPLLLSAMKHQVIVRAQKGPRQYGVDVVSVGPGTNGRRTLFLWLIKCGDIGRTEWSSGPQAVRPSIEDVGDVYLPTHVPPQYAELPKRLVVLTNGEYKSTIGETLSQYLKAWSAQQKVEAHFEGGSTLAAWTEEYLLDENALPSSARTLFRRMLANISSPELCIQAGRQLIDTLLNEATEPAKNVNGQRKRHLIGLRAIRTALSILHLAGQKEQNLLASCRVSEFAVLAIWARFQAVIESDGNPVAKEFSETLFQMLNVGLAYHSKLEPFYLVKDALAYSAPDSIVVAERVFGELGRLGLHGSTWALYGAQGNFGPAIELAQIYGTRIAALLESHSCSASPVYDHQAIDIHAALLCLMAVKRQDIAKRWLRNIIIRLLNVVELKKYWPMFATYEELLEVRHGDAELEPELASTDILIPVLAIWTGALGMEDGYAAIRDKLLPRLEGKTLNVWSPDKGFDLVVSDQAKLNEHGVGEALGSLPGDPRQFLSDMTTPLSEVQSIEQQPWYRFQIPYIPIAAALHWRLQIPREMMAKQVMALTQASVVDQGVVASPKPAPPPVGN